MCATGGLTPSFEGSEKVLIVTCGSQVAKSTAATAATFLDAPIGNSNTPLRNFVGERDLLSASALVTEICHFS